MRQASGCSDSSPEVDANTVILILGTLPSDKSIAAGQYYANPGNDFWKLIGAVLNKAFAGLSYGDKIELLKANRIGLWDAYHSCVRPGSMDGDITEQEPNDFGTLRSIAPSIRLICFNSRKAAQAEASLHALGYETRILPSSSGANRRDQEGRLAHWKEAIRFMATELNSKYGLPPQAELDDMEVLSPEASIVPESIFHKVVRNENSYTQLLCNVMRRDKGFCRTLLTLFAGENPRWRFGGESFSPQTRLRDNCGQPDLIIESPTHYMIVEVKTESHRVCTPKQELLNAGRGYLSDLTKKHLLGIETALTFLVPHNWKFREEVEDVNDLLKTSFFEHPPRPDRYRSPCFRGCGSV